MITKVLDEHGHVLHDCALEGCEFSWDGYAISDVPAERIPYPANATAAQRVAIAKGKRADNATDPDANVYEIRGNTAKIKR